MVTNNAVIPKFETVAGDFTLIQIGGFPSTGTLSYADSYHAPAEFGLAEPTRPVETLLRYFTSGTTSKAKLVENTHASYPAGYLSTIYWIGLEPGDVHLNVASPGLGEARMVEYVHPVDRRSDRIHLQL